MTGLKFPIDVLDIVCRFILYFVTILYLILWYILYYITLFNILYIMFCYCILIIKSYGPESIIELSLEVFEVRQGGTEP